MDNLTVGCRVESKKNSKVQGKVERIIKNEQGDVTYVIVRNDETGETHKMPSTFVRKISLSPQDTEMSVASSPVIFAENKFFSYIDFFSVNG